MKYLVLHLLDRLSLKQTVSDRSGNADELSEQYVELKSHLFVIFTLTHSRNNSNAGFYQSSPVCCQLADFCWSVPGFVREPH